MQKVGAIVLSIFAFFVLLFLYTKIAGPISFSINSITTTKSDTFNVSGEGSVTVKPDIALISAGVTAKGNTVKEAQDQINTVSNNIAASIKKLGVEEKDIQTTNYTINPNYDFQSNIQRITGYNASTNFLIKIRNIDLINQVIDAATTSGANQISSISFDVDEKAKAEDEARKKAVDAAKKKAESAARIAGFRLGKLVNYSENFGGGAFPIPLSRDLSISAGSPKTEIEPGSSEIKVVVTLSYEIL